MARHFGLPMKYIASLRSRFAADIVSVALFSVAFLTKVAMPGSTVPDIEVDSKCAVNEPATVSYEMLCILQVSDGPEHPVKIVTAISVRIIPTSFTI